MPTGVRERTVDILLKFKLKLVLRELTPTGSRERIVDMLLKFKLILVLRVLTPNPVLFARNPLIRARFIVQRVLIVFWPMVVLSVDRPIVVKFEREARLVLNELVPRLVLL